MNNNSGEQKKKKKKSEYNPLQHFGSINLPNVINHVTRRLHRVPRLGYGYRGESCVPGAEDVRVWVTLAQSCSSWRAIDFLVFNFYCNWNTFRRTATGRHDEDIIIIINDVVPVQSQNTINAYLIMIMTIIVLNTLSAIVSSSCCNSKVVQLVRPYVVW